MSFLSRDATVAKPGFNRWLVPPAAIAVHMCIGQVYGFSVFKKPLAKLIGVTAPVAGDWTEAQVGVAYSIALALLGLSAAVFGKWVERSGPRKTMVASMICFCLGLVLASLSVKFHQLWLLYAGYGLIGGIGLGLGYIAPVSTLMKWFPDRPGMATGMAIMGFGGGALIGGATLRDAGTARDDLSARRRRMRQAGLKTQHCTATDTEGRSYKPRTYSLASATGYFRRCNPGLVHRAPNQTVNTIERSVGMHVCSPRL